MSKLALANFWYRRHHRTKNLAVRTRKAFDAYYLERAKCFGPVNRYNVACARLIVFASPLLATSMKTVKR